MMSLAPLLMESNSYKFNAGYATSGTAKALGKIDSKLNFKQSIRRYSRIHTRTKNLTTVEKSSLKLRIQLR